MKSLEEELYKDFYGEYPPIWTKNREFNLILIPNPLLVKILNKLPVSLAYFIFSIYIGFYKSQEAFWIWRYIMTNDVDVKSRLFGSTLLDELYARTNISN